MDFDDLLSRKGREKSSDDKDLHTETGSKYQEKAELGTKSVSLSEQDHPNLLSNKSTCFLQSLEGKTINIAAVNIDVVDSTKKIKVLSNGDAGVYYQTFIESASDLIQTHGGYILKNVGDCVIGFFPCGKHNAENHEKAVVCGLALRDMIRDSLNPYFMARKLPSIACRISADVGAVAVIRIRFNGDYSVIDLFGDALNSATKILRSALPNQMVIGDKLFWEVRHSEDLDFKLIRDLDFRKHVYPVYLVERSRCKKER